MDDLESECALRAGMRGECDEAVRGSEDSADALPFSLLFRFPQTRSRWQMDQDGYSIPSSLSSSSASWRFFRFSSPGARYLMRMAQGKRGS